MFKHETFPNAPITEAVADIEVEYKTAPALDDLRGFGRLASERFPMERERRRFTTSLSYKEDEPIFENSQQRFFAYTSSDGKYVAQVRPDGFAFSRLRPYVSWADFLSKAEAAWTLYDNAFRPERVKRISLKYVNRIEFPQSEDIKEYFITRLHIAPKLPQKLSEAFWTAAVIDDLSTDIGTLTFAIDREQSTVEMRSVVFDVEAVHPGPMDSDIATIRRQLERLRDFKNRLFFLSITDKAKRLFR